MDFAESAEDEAFRSEVRTWLAAHLVGRFADIGEGQDRTASAAARAEWERELGRGGWIGVSWPKEYGDRGLSLQPQVILGEEFARARDHDHRRASTWPSAVSMHDGRH